MARNWFFGLSSRVLMLMEEKGLVQRLSVEQDARLKKLILTEKSARMEQMLLGRGEQDADWIRRFCKRKWNSELSREMSRSCTEMVRDWCEEE